MLSNSIQLSANNSILTPNFVLSIQQNSHSSLQVVGLNELLSSAEHDQPDFVHSS